MVARDRGPDGSRLTADQMDGQDAAADLPGSGSLSPAHTACEDSDPYLPVTAEAPDTQALIWWPEGDGY